MPSLSKNVSSEERFAIVGKWLSHPKPGDEVVITGKKAYRFLQCGPRV